MPLCANIRVTPISLLLLACSACAPATLRPIDQELLRAATLADAAAVDAALEQGAAARARGTGGWTPLMLAARSGDVAAVTALLKRGADANERNDLGETALMVCAPNVVKPLVDAGAKVNAHSAANEVPTLINGDTALTRTSDVEKTRALLAAGAEVNASDGFGQTALTRAASRGESERVAMLLEAGGDVHATQLGGATALTGAAYQGDAETVHLLLNAGADIGARNSDGRTALHFAATNRHHGVVDALLAAHPEVNARDRNGSTPLLLAVRDAVVENVRSLLAAGADPGIPDATGRTVMQWAIARGDQEMVALLGPTGVGTPREGGAGFAEMQRAARQERDGRLEVFTTDVITDGRVAKIRGRVRSRYAQRIEGIRYELLVFEPSSGRVLDTLKTEVNTVLEPDQDAPLRLDFQSSYFAGEPRFVLQAFPVRAAGQP